MMDGMTIRRITPDDLIAVRKLLHGAGLDSEDIVLDQAVFFIAEKESTPVGTIGLELYGPTALLRSAAVLPAWRDRGIGDRLVAAVVDEAVHRGVKELFLLTETAKEYFSRKGFVGIARGEVSGDILTSSQFRGACPASARVMRRRLQSPDRAS